MADSADDKTPFHLPSQYRFLKVLGEGSFGKVVKCWKKDTKHTVAVKIPKFFDNTSKEVSMLKMFMQLNLDQRNIVKFFGWFHMSCGRALVFETLDISIDDYILKTRCAPMLLSDISTIIQQVATAFDALKSVGVIHTDIKPDNIMLVDHRRRPFKVKLIDFGLAELRSKVTQLMTLQPVAFRSPEMILGLPFSEAIDMWSLGCVMATMIFGAILFPGPTEYEALQLIVELLGQPADHHLNDGGKTRLYFNRTEFNSWRLKTPQEYWGTYPPRNHRAYKFQSLDDLKKMRLERKNKAEADEREQCIELMKAMLKMDETERITPSEVLTHPFIAKGHHNSHNEASASAAAQRSTKKGKTRFKKTKKKKTIKSINGGLNPTSTQPPSSLIVVRPAAAMESDVSLQTHVNRKHWHIALVSISRDFDCEPPATTNIHPDHRSPSPTIPPSGVIMVRPAAAKNTLQMEDQESAVSLQAGLNKTSEQVTESDTTAWISEDSTTCDDTRTKKKKKKKKKKYFRRFFSWMKKTFCSCWTCIDEDEEGEK